MRISHSFHRCCGTISQLLESRFVSLFSFSLSLMLQKLLFNGNVHGDLLSSASMVLILKAKLSEKHLP